MKDIDYNLIVKHYRNHEMEKSAVIDLLVLLVQNDNNTRNRYKAISFLDDINAFDNTLFKFIENLIISDSDPIIRKEALFILKKYYLKRALNIVKWAIRYENDYNCLISIINILVQINSLASKELIVSKLRRKIKCDKNNINNLAIRKYSSLIQKLYNNQNINSLSHNDIAKILIGYLTLNELIQRFYSVHYEINPNTCLPVKLDLSDIEFEVRGWKAEFRNGIENLSDIIGLTNLQSLEHLDLSNNRIRNIEKLTKLKNLKKLYLSNNQIQEEKNLDYLKEFKKLEYLDITGNNIVNDQRKFILNKNIEIKLHKINYFR